MFGSACPEAKWHLAAPQLDTKWKFSVTEELKHMWYYTKLQPVAKVLTVSSTQGGGQAELGREAGQEIVGAVKVNPIEDFERRRQGLLPQLPPSCLACAA